jgi:Rrf2 family transcriptional regulator, iron-sulfur cluster assembly transcription factor
MTPYGKTAQTAISAVSRLAEVYDPEKRIKLSSGDISTNRHLPQPIVAKVLTILSQAGIVNGSPGPGGGYWLARAPQDLSLYDVVKLFERLEQNVSCPFGPDYCGSGPHCPLHLEMLNVREQMLTFLKSNNFAGFIAWDEHPEPTKKAMT